MANVIQFGIRFDLVNGQATANGVQQIGQVTQEAGALAQSAGAQMAGALNTTTQAVGRNEQAVGRLMETEAQATQRIREMVAASSQESAAFNQSSTAANAAAEAIRRVADESGNQGRGAALAAAQMAQVQAAGAQVAEILGASAQAANRNDQAVVRLAETEAQAAQRIREMVAASMQEVSAFNQTTAAANAASESIRRASDETGNQGRSAAAATAQMAQAHALANQATTVSSEESQKYVTTLQRQFDAVGRSAAEQAQYQARMLGGSKAVQDQAYALVNNTEALKAQIAAEERSAQAADKFIAKLREQASTIGLNRTQLLQLQAAQLGVAEEAGPLIAQLGKAEGAANSAGHATAGVTRELMVLGREAASGDFAAMPGSFMVLAEQVNITSLLLNPLVIGLAAVAAGAAVVGTAMATSHEHLVEMNNAIAFTGNYAGQTRDSMNGMAASVASGGQVTIGTAKDIVTALVASGQVGGEALGKIAHLASNYAKVTHQEIDEVGPKLAKLFSDPSRGARELNEQMHFLTAAEIEHIDALKRVGEKQLAQLELADKLAIALPAQAQNVTWLGKKWQELKNFISTVNDEMGKQLDTNSAESKIKSLQALQQRYEAIAQMGGGYLKAGGERISADQARAAAKDVEKQIADQRALQEAANVAAKAEAERRKQAELTRAAQDEVNKSQVTRIARLKDELALIANAPDSAAKSQRQLEIQKEIAATYRAMGADERGLTQQKFANEEALTQVRLKMRADEISTAYQLGSITKLQFDARMGNVQIEQLQAKQLYERRLANLSGLTALERKAHADKVAHLDEELDLLQLQQGNRKDVDAKKAQDELIASIQQAGIAANKSLDDQIAKQKQHNAEIGKSKAEIEMSRQAVVDLDTRQLESDANFIRNAIEKEGFEKDALAAYTMRLAYLDNEVTKRKELSKLFADGAVLQANSKLADQAAKDWERTGRSVQKSLSDAFGQSGKAAGDMFRAFSTGMAEQLNAQRDLAAAKALKDDNPEKIQAVQRAQLAGQMAQVAAYSDMATAAQGFFSEGSKGYKAMQAASMALHTAEVSLSLIKGVNAVLTQGEGDPYTAFARMAAMTALVTGLGVAIGGGGGGGGGATAAQVQKTQGTGTVFGDSTAKSDSIRRAMDQLAENSDNMLPINQAMLTALKSIDSSIAGLTNLVVRTSGLTDGKNMGIQTGVISQSPQFDPTLGAIAGGTAAGAYLGSMAGAFMGPLGIALGSVLGSVLGGVASKVASLWGKTSQTIIDSGLQYGGSVRGLQQGQGFDQYASIDTTKKSWFGLSKSTSNRIETQGVGEELSRQLGLIFDNLDKSLQAASVALGGSADDVTKVLDGLVLETTKVSLKDLKGDELTDALNAVISKSMDQIAQAAFPKLDQFSKVGEGYAETVMRLAGDYAKLDAVLAGIGGTFGAVGMDSIAAREKLIELAGGIDSLAGQTSSYAENFMSKAERLAPVQAYVTKEMAALGLQSVDTREAFKKHVQSLIDSGKLVTEEGQKEFAALMSVQEAFAQTHAATKDLTKSEQEIADERTNIQDRLDELTMNQAQLAEKARAAIAPYNLGLYDQMVAAQKAKDAIAEASAILDIQGQIASVTGEKVAAAAVLERQHIAALVDMSPALAEANKQLWDAQANEKARSDALTISNGILSNQAAMYEATGDKANAALVAQAQWEAALAAMEPALRASANAAHLAQLAEKDRAAALTISNGILSNQAAMYEATGDKANAALVAQAQWEAALAAMDPALRDSATAARQAQQAEKDRAAALTISNGILSNQAAMYEASGNKAGAAMVAQQQWAAALAAMDPQLRDSAIAAHQAQAFEKDRTAAISSHSAALVQQARLYELTNDTVLAARAIEEQRAASLVGQTQEVIYWTRAAWAAEDAEKARTKALTESNTLLDLQARTYAATGDKAAAAAVLQKQHEAALVGLTPVIAEATKAMWEAEAAQTAQKEALDRSNSLLQIQAQIYELTGDKAGAAAVLEQQHAAALAAMDPALRSATQTLWDLQAKAAQRDALKSFGDALAESINKAKEAAEAFRSLNDALLVGESSTLSPEQKYLEAKRQFETADANTLQSAQKAFLDASKAWFGSTAGYAADFAAVLARNNSMAAQQDSYQNAVPAIWESIQKSMGVVNGSHASGLDFVPFDNYRANLHKGERVQTASQVINERAARDQTVLLLGQIVESLSADKTQRAAATGMMMKGLARIESGVAGTKRQLARIA